MSRTIKAESFIAEKLKFRSALTVSAISVSYLVIIVAVAISAGFRREIRDGISAITGDVKLSCYADTVSASPQMLERISSIRGVSETTPTIYKAGIVKGKDDIQGVMVKGVPSTDSLALQVRIPEKLAKSLKIETGDRMLTYFIEDKVKVRNFTVSEIYRSPVEADGQMLVYASLSDMQRLCGWSQNAATAIEISIDDKYRNEIAARDKAGEIGSAAMEICKGPETPVAEAYADLYPQLFDWLSLIDFNVFAILLLMTVVAGFNMVSGLLILLFRHISTIGTLKALGMDDKGISGVFLKVSSRTALTGMAIGNASAFLFCLVQGSTHLIKLNPANYFVSFVPVELNIPLMLFADIASYGVIMLLLLIPTLFIAKIDPAQTVRVR